MAAFRRFDGLGKLVGRGSADYEKYFSMQYVWESLPGLKSGGVLAAVGGFWLAPDKLLGVSYI